MASTPNEGAGSAVALETQEAPLPKLELKQTVETESLFQGTGQQIELMFPWQDYTFVVPQEGGAKIRVFDKNGSEVHDFAPLAYMKINCSEQKFKNELGDRKRYFSLNQTTSAEDVHINNLPIGLRYFVFNILRSNQTAHAIFTGVTPNFVVKNLTLSFNKGGKYIVLKSAATDIGSPFIAFCTQNDQGATLPPRNWKRIDTSTTQKYDELEPYLAFLKTPGESNSRSIPLNEKYSIRASDEDIDIIDATTGSSVFTDKVALASKNVCTDPANPSVIYYCSSVGSQMIKLDCSGGDPSSWHTKALHIPKIYPEKSGLSLDPTGRFFLLNSMKSMPGRIGDAPAKKTNLVVLAKDTLEEVGQEELLMHAHFDPQGRLRAMNKDGQLAYYETNLTEIGAKLDERRATKALAGIEVDLFEDETAAAAKKAQEQGEKFAHLKPAKEKYATQFDEPIKKASDLENLGRVQRALEKLLDQLKQAGMSTAEIAFITSDIQTAIHEKEKEFAGREVADRLAKVRGKLGGAVSITILAEAREDLKEAEKLKGLVDDAVKKEIRDITDEIGAKSAELFAKEGVEIEKELSGLVEGVTRELGEFTKPQDFADWEEYDLPQLRASLGNLLRDCPLGAETVRKKIVEARRKLDGLKKQFKEKFEHEYEQIRQKEEKGKSEIVGTLEQDMAEFIDRLRGKKFTDRKSAEGYVQRSKEYDMLKTQMEALEGKAPEAGKTLLRTLKVNVSNVYSEIERGALVKIAESGAQMTLFGKEPFEIYAAPVKEKGRRSVDIEFIEEERSKGPGVSEVGIFGDIGLRIKGSHGTVEHVRLFEGFEDENDWRYGAITYRGAQVPASYVTQGRYREIKKAYADWAQGEKSRLRTQEQALHRAIREHYKSRPKEKSGEAHEAWKSEYLCLMEEYGKFRAENYIAVLKRIEQVSLAPEAEYTNGKGYVPQWKNHWTTDPLTEKYLEEMAENLNMQEQNMESICMLKGHAGTGKDVLVKIFCNRTKRPYFAIDCSKWTTEAELGEDIQLSSKKGASETIRVPSIVLNAIKTPGAVMYFNEFNAMTEQAQIFLHALFDEKRTLTLKTSGQTVQAHPSVLLLGSMNPDYEGTFAPQFATESRFAPIAVEYPPLHREKDTGDPNPNPPFDVSEALRIARSVASFENSTIEANMKENEFVKMWDKAINGIQNDAPEMNAAQKFDMEVILSLVQFGNKFREAFIKIIEQDRDAQKVLKNLPATQPITLREMRRSAYFLNKMTPEEKAGTNPEEVARRLLARCYLKHYHKRATREQLGNAMKTWTSQKRAA